MTGMSNTRKLLDIWCFERVIVHRSQFFIAFINCPEFPKR